LFYALPPSGSDLANLMIFKKICPSGRGFSALNPVFHAPKQPHKVSHGSTGKIAPVSIAFLSSWKDDLGFKNAVLRSKKQPISGCSFAISLYSQSRPE
jgi:hypothetical protein